MADSDQQPVVRLSETTRFNFSGPAMVALVIACFAAGAWATALQVQVARNTTILNEMQVDLRELRRSLSDSRYARLP